jgi:hypothetical protein
MGSPDSRDAGSVQPVDGGPLPGDDRQALDRALAGGAPDPFSLLTRGEAEAAIGAPVGDPSLARGDGTVGACFCAEGRDGQRWELSVDVVHGAEGEPLDAQGYWRDVVTAEHSAEGTPIDAVGDQAIHAGGCLYVLAPPHVFSVYGRTPGGDAPLNALGGVARLVLPRLVQP